MSKPRRAKNAHPSDCFKPPRLLDDRDQRRQVLLEKARAGSREALGDLFTEHQSMMRSFILRQLPHKLAAKLLDDLTQDTLLKATAAFAEFVGEHVAQFTDWLLKICHNVLADFVRKFQRSGAMELPIDEIEETDRHLYGAQRPSPDEVFEAFETAAQLRAALGELDEVERRSVNLHVEGGLSLREVAGRLNLSIDSIKRAFRQIVARLKLRLGAVAQA